MECKRLTKDIKDVEQTTIGELLLNSCYYDKTNDNRLFFRHITDAWDANYLVYNLFDTFSKETCIVLPDNSDYEDNRGIYIDNAMKDIFTIDGLLCNFYCLIEANAKLRERLKVYEDKEFGEDNMEE